MVMVELSQSNWEEEVSRSNILTLVYFWHQQCPWCRQLTPILKRVAEEYLGKIKFTSLNILETPSNQEIALNLGVMSTPTLIFFCSGRPLMQIVGYTTEEDLRKVLDDMLRRYRTCLLQSTDLRGYIV
jgi:thioredoxin 1